MARLRGHSGLTDRGLVRGASAPSSAAIGQLWFNTGTGVLYQYTNDGASSVWVDISSGGIGSSISEGVDFVGDTDPIKSTNGTGLAVGSVYLNREKTDILYVLMLQPIQMFGLEDILEMVEQYQNILLVLIIIEYIFLPLLINKIFI